MLRLVVPGEEVTRQRHQVGLQVIGDRGVPPDLVRGHEGADVEIGQLDDAETIKCLGQARQGDPLMRYLEVQPSIEQSIGTCEERRRSHADSGLFQEPAPAGGKGLGRMGNAALVQPPPDRLEDAGEDP